MNHKIKVGPYWEAKDGGSYCKTISEALKMIEAWRRTDLNIRSDRFTLLLPPGLSTVFASIELPAYVKLRGAK